MATRLFMISAGGNLETITESAGPTQSSATQVSLIVDLATNTVGEGSTTRQILRSEVMTAIENLEAYLTRINWPPV